MVSASTNRKRRQRARDAEKATRSVRNAKRRRTLHNSISAPEHVDAIRQMNDLASHETSSLQSDVMGESNSFSSAMAIREEALRRITQFRAPPSDDTPHGAKIAQEMSKIRDEIRRDLLKHEQAVNPVHYSVCKSCGHETPRSSSVAPQQATLDNWLSFLQRKLHWSSRDQDSYRFCSTCVNSLRRKQVPFGALCRGWVFEEEVPEELHCLTRYERLLISLRLPCVYIWRSQGGFGQYGCRGSPVSFSNPVEDLARKLPRRASRVFHILLESGVQVDICSAKIRRALQWLKRYNPLCADIEIDEAAFQEMVSLETDSCDRPSTAMFEQGVPPPPTSINIPRTDTTCSGTAENSDNPLNVSRARPSSPNTGDRRSMILAEEMLRGTQGPIDVEVLERLSERVVTGVEDSSNPLHAQLLIKHILRPFAHRRSDILPSYDALENLESYFPVLFPRGKGGPKSLGCKFGLWVKHVMKVRQSRFLSEVDFIFFVYSIMKRKGLTGLSLFAPVRTTSTNSIVQVRDMLASDLPHEVVARRIEKLLRSGSLSASFETLKGSAAFWASLKRTAWAYLTSFGPCQLFITISAADLIDPYVYCQIDPTLTIDQARALCSRQRADMLAENPVSAVKIFHRRIQSIFDNFLFGEARPFGTIKAFLGRIEQQARHSPHLHLLLWLEKKCPNALGGSALDAVEVANFIELFCTAQIPGDNPTPAHRVPPPSQENPPTRHIPLRRAQVKECPNLNPSARQELLSRPYNCDVFDGSVESNRELRGQILASQAHKCNAYCLRNGTSCRFLVPFPSKARAGIAVRGPGNAENGDVRFVALAPRYYSNLNSTHPLLTAFCHSNTDVTIVTGNSIAECMYAVGYAVKSGNNPLFNQACVRRLKSLNNGVDDRKLLGAIARNATGLTTVGSKEDSDFLLDNPVTFTSAEVCNINPLFMLCHPSAISDTEMSMVSEWASRTENGVNLLTEVDIDEEVAASSHAFKGLSKRDPSKRQPDRFLEGYMRRPLSLESLDAFAFNSAYVIRRLYKKRANFNSEMLLLPSCENHHHNSYKGNFIVERRKQNPRRPDATHILNVPSRGMANESSPFFAAAALAMYVPFRNVEDLLQGNTLTGRLKKLLEDNSYPKMTEYVNNCSELSMAMARPLPKNGNSINNGIGGTDPDHMFDEQCNEDGFEEDMESENLLAGLSPLLFSDKSSDPIAVET